MHSLHESNRFILINRILWPQLTNKALIFVAVKINIFRMKDVEFDIECIS